MKINALLFCLVCLCTAGLSLACSCMLPPAPVEAMGNADVVFTARVLRVDQPEKTDEEMKASNQMGPRGGIHGIEFELEILTRVKGIDADVKHVRLRTGHGGGDCGYPFEEGGEYLIYGNENLGRYHTNICTRTRVLDADGKAELKVLEEAAVKPQT